MSGLETRDRLQAESLQAALGPVVIGREIVVLEETTSTNDSLLQITTAQTKEGLVVFAEHQTAGRGQRGNQWESSAHQGLWFSILLRPRIGMAESPRLTTWAAQSVARTIQTEFPLAATIKLPNDVQIAGKKVAGVLVELRAQTGAPHVAIAGIGINANQSARDFSEELRPHAISLAMALNRPIDRQKFAVALLQDLDRTYAATFPP